MAKRKKYPKLPNGFGSIRYLGKGRRKPYAVHPPTTQFTKDGVPIRPKALCYVSDYYVGLAVLSAYRNGSYRPGMEQELSLQYSNNKTLSDVLIGALNASESLRTAPTFSEVFSMYYNDKYLSGKKYSESTLRYPKAAYRHCKALYDRPFRNISLDELQSVIDSCNLKHASLELIKNLFRGMYNYAVPHDITDRNLGKYVKIKKADDDEHGIPYSEQELSVLWGNKGNMITDTLLIMCYSGFRISECDTLSINLEEGYFQGGIKTKAGRNRIVPIHSSIYDIVQCRDKILPCSINVFRKRTYTELDKLGLQRHTPHDCRHTFSMLCDKYGVNNIAKRKMLGHAFGSDLSNGTYGHWNLDMLIPEIEKIVTNQ